MSLVFIKRRKDLPHRNHLEPTVHHIDDAPLPVDLRQVIETAMLGILFWEDHLVVDMIQVAQVIVHGYLLDLIDQLINR